MVDLPPVGGIVPLSSQLIDEGHSNSCRNLRWFVYNLVRTFEVEECLRHYQQASIQSTLWFEHQRSQRFGNLIMCGPAFEYTREDFFNDASQQEWDEWEQKAAELEMPLDYYLAEFV